MMLDGPTIDALGYASSGDWFAQRWAHSIRVRELNAAREAAREAKRGRRRRSVVVRADGLTAVQMRAISYRHKRGASVPEIVAACGARRGLVLAYMRQRGMR